MTWTLLAAGCTIEAADEDPNRDTLKASVEAVDVQAVRDAMDARGIDAAARRAIIPHFGDTALRYGHTHPEKVVKNPLGNDLEEVLDELERYALYDGVKGLYGNGINLTRRAERIEENGRNFQLALLSLVQSASPVPADRLARAALGDLAYQFGYAECVARAVRAGPLTEPTRLDCQTGSLRGAIHVKSQLLLWTLDRMSVIGRDRATEECATLGRVMAPLASTPLADPIRADAAAICEDPIEPLLKSLQTSLQERDLEDRTPVDALLGQLRLTTAGQLAALEALPRDIQTLVNALAESNPDEKENPLLKSARTLQKHDRRRNEKQRRYLELVLTESQDLVPLFDRIDAQRGELTTLSP